MEKTYYLQSISEKIDKNFDEFSQFFEYKCEIFYELRSLIFEINTSLILGNHRSAITLTNHLLERLLKITLIQNEVGLGPIPVEDWNRIFKVPHIKYTTVKLGNSIEKCRKLGLLTEAEKTFLFGIVREMMRNGFSHADSTKITDKLPEQITVFTGKLNQPHDLAEIKLDRASLPIIQSQTMESFAKNNAKDYFEFIFNLIGNIETRLKYFHKHNNNS